jgi:hypothetical protein
MALKGEKKVTAVATADGVTYGPYEFSTFTGGKLTAATSKKRKGAGQDRRVRVGAADVENATATLENDGTVPLKMLWGLRRRAKWSITSVPADEDGNPRSQDAFTRTGKLVGMEDGDSDVEDDAGIDMATLEFALDSVVS